MQYLERKFLFFFIIVFHCLAYSNIATTHINASKGLVNNTVRCFFESDNGELWIGTDGGISIYNGYTFKSITTNDGLAGNFVWNIIADDFGGKWIACYNGGLTYLKNDTFTSYKQPEGLTNLLIRTIYYHNEMLLIGTDYGLLKFDYQTKEITPIEPPNKTQNHFQIMQFLVEKNELYVLTRKEGIYKLNFDENESASLFKIGQGSTLFKLIPIANQYLYCDENGVYLQNNMIGEKESKLNTNVVWDYTFTENNKDLYLASWNVVEEGGALLKYEGNYLVDYNKKYNINSKLIWTCKYLKTKQLVVGSLDKGFYIIDLQLQNKTEFDIPNIKGNFILDGNIYYFNDKNIYNKKGISVFSLSNEIVSKWSSQNKMFHATLADNITTKEDLKNKNQFISFVKVFDSGVYVSTSMGLLKLSKQFELEKIMLLRIDDFHIFNTTLLYQRSFKEFNIVKNFLSNTPIREKLEMAVSSPTDIVKYQQIGDSVFMWTQLKGLFIYKEGELPYKLLIDENIGDLKFADTWQNEVIVVNYNNEVFKGSITKSGVQLKKIDLPIEIKSIYNVAIEQQYFMVYYDGGIYLSNNTESRILNQSNMLEKMEVFDCFLTAETLDIVAENSLIKIPIEGIFTHKTQNPIITFSNALTTIAYHQNSLVFDIEKKSLAYPNNYQYFYRINELDTIPVSNDKIYLMNLSGGNYTIDILAFDTFQNTWLTLATHNFKKQKAPWERWYVWILGFATLLIVGIVIYYKRKEIVNKQLIEQQRIKKEIVKHKLEAIQAKMNPHFMFNSLNSIQNYIIDADTDNALLYLSEFSKLMRQTVEYSSTNAISLAEEIDFLERYIRIEQMRFSNKIVLEKKIEGSPNNIEVPPMILQPLIENAFIHALDTNSNEAQVIFLQIDTISNNLIKISIANKKSNKKTSSKNHKSFGIASIEKRLKLVNTKNTLIVKNTNVSFEVEIELYLNDK